MILAKQIHECNLGSPIAPLMSVGGKFMPRGYVMLTMDESEVALVSTSRFAFDMTKTRPVPRMDVKLHRLWAVDARCITAVGDVILNDRLIEVV